MSGLFNKKKDGKTDDGEERILSDKDITGAFKGVMDKIENISTDVSALSQMVIAQNRSVEQIMRTVKDLPEFKQAEVKIKAQTIVVRQDQFDSLLESLAEYDIDYEQLDFKK